MPKLQSLDVPARLRELSEDSRAAWSSMFSDHMAQFASKFPQFYDPIASETPAQLAPAGIVWSAFPATLRAKGLTSEARWRLADSSRDHQDEYCEWTATRDGDGNIRAVTFTTEIPEYWSHIGETEPELLLELYRRWASDEVTRDDLFDDGVYRRNNKWNDADSAGVVHLRQSSNTMLAAIQLVADSTILRQRADGTPVTDRQELVRCGRLGEPLRNSDPQIAEVVNDAASMGAEVTLSDPLGLYLDGLQAAGIEAPDGADAADFWTVERGTAEFAVRAVFTVPAERGYTVADLRIAGRPVTFGGQVADKVRVRIDAFAKPGTHHEPRQLCEP